MKEEVAEEGSISNLMALPAVVAGGSQDTSTPGPSMRQWEKRSLPTKQASLNDELFCAERQKERVAVREQVQRQQSLPVQATSADRGGGVGGSQQMPITGRTFKESLLAAAQQAKQFERLRESLSKLRGSSSTSVPNASSIPVPSASIVDEQSAGSCTAAANPNEPSIQPSCSSSSTSFKHSLVKIIHRWKSEQQDGDEQLGSSSSSSHQPATPSFTRKRGVTIDPINVFGVLRRDQSLDSATRRGLFHKKGAWSPKSPKLEPRDHQQQQQQQLASPLLENPGLLSPIRRCCLECPDTEASSGRERRLSRSEASSDSSSKDSSIQSDTSLDSEDSCISVIFVPHPAGRGSGAGGAEAAEAVTVRTGSSGSGGGSSSSQRSTSNSSESSESPTSKGSPMSPGNSQGLSPVRALSTSKSKSLPGISVTGPPPSSVTTYQTLADSGVSTAANVGDIQAGSLKSSIMSSSPSPLGFPSISTSSSGQTLAKIPEEEPQELKETVPQKKSILNRGPEHRSFELEDLPAVSSPLGLANRVEIAGGTVSRGSISGQQQSASSRRLGGSKYDYPIVKHHPLFAKSSKGHSGISSLLLGENIEFMRKPGRSLSHGIQSVRRSTPKLLTFEIYNPETDDLDSDTSHSSSPDSDDSIISVIADCFQKNYSPSGDGAEMDGGGEESQPAHHHPGDLSVHQSAHPTALSETPAQSTYLSQLGDAPAQPKDEQSSLNLTGNDQPSLNLQLSLEDIDRKSEERTKGLLSLLGENKTVLQRISKAKGQRIGGSSEHVLEAASKTACQLRSMEELWLPRSKSCSPDKTELRNLEKIDRGVNLSMISTGPLKLGSLDSILGPNPEVGLSSQPTNISFAGSSTLEEDEAEKTAVEKV